MSITQQLDVTPPAVLSIADQAKARIEEAILNGHFAPGERLKETELAEWLGVSRAPVRQALQGLSYEGLISLTPRRGAIVVNLNDHILLEALDLREVLEGLAARWAAERLTSAQVAQIEHGLDSVRERMARSPSESYPSDVFDLHRFLLIAAESPLLSDMMKPIKSLVRLGRTLSGNRGERLPTALAEHIEILDAIRDRDAARAEATMRHHMRQSRTNLLS